VRGGRRQGREAALSILYFWEIGRAEPDEAIAEYFRLHAPDADKAVKTFAGELVRGTIADVERVDALIGSHARNWRMDRLAVIDRLILRMAVWELTRQAETPPPVVLNEAIELARAFGTDDSVRFVNGVLDGVRKTLAEACADGA
jgi:N utilization substance protein B